VRALDDDEKGRWSVPTPGLDADEKGLSTTQTPGGPQEVLTVTEAEERARPKERAP
jgi:hypothetical protein